MVAYRILAPKLFNPMWLGSVCVLCINSKGHILGFLFLFLILAFPDIDPGPDMPWTFSMFPILCPLLFSSLQVQYLTLTTPTRGADLRSLAGKLLRLLLRLFPRNIDLNVGLPKYSLC